MDGNYEIFQDGKQVGKAHIRREGLYYCFSCRCSPAGQKMMDLMVICEDRTENLGICVPVDGQFGVERKLPVKRFGTGTPEFLLWPRGENFPRPEMENTTQTDPEEPAAVQTEYAAENETAAENREAGETEGSPEEQSDTFIPVREEEPFAYLSRLQNAHLESRDGQVGIVLET